MNDPSFHQPMFEIKRPRPRRFTGPESPLWGAKCRELLEKEDEQFDWRDYQALFSELESIGTYEESVYFLPQAFSRILTHREEALDMIDSVLGFCSYNAGRLDSDGALQAVRTAIRIFLNTWTAHFRATPNEVQVLDESLGILIRKRVHMDIAEEFVLALSRSLQDPARASWFLKLAVYVDGGYSELPAHAPMVEIVRGEDFLVAAAATVRKRLSELGEESGYLDYCLDQLGL